MRTLFLFLLLSNILFLAWTQWIAPPAMLPGRATPSSDDSSRIRLIGEVSPVADTGNAPGADAGSSTAKPDDAVGAGPGLPAASCVSAGPFLAQAQADEGASRLARLGFASRMRPGTEELRIGSWVRVSNLGTPLEAEAARDALRDAGIEEAYIVTDGTPGITISLGVFADAARAAQVADLARSAGFEVQVSDRYRTAEVYWLDIDREANAGLPPIEDLRGTDPAQPAFELRACPERGSRP